MALLLSSVLAEHGIPFERHRNLFGMLFSGEKAAERVISLLRQVLSEPERQALMVVDEMLDKDGSPDASRDFPWTQSLDEWWRAHQTEWFSAALSEDRFETWFQPIVSPGGDPGGRVREERVREERVGEGLGGAFTPKLLAHECLIRLNSGRLYGGAEIIDAALTRNEIHRFDSYARRLAIRSAAAQSRRGKYFVNFMPSSIYNPELCMRSTMEALGDCGMKPENIVFEVVESDHVRDVSHLRRICDYYRAHGFGFALDDMGTGTNSLQMMCDLRPDFIKLDKSLVANVEQPMYAATIRKLVELAGQFSTIVIAEGVEREQTMENLWLLGVQWMQGYLFGRPEPRVCHEAPALIPRARTRINPSRSGLIPVTLAH
jgi:EAL domain-containing protein (putative c-di-GMP-specific phosphodiesterase class I)